MRGGGRQLSNGGEEADRLPRHVMSGSIWFC